MIKDIDWGESVKLLSIDMVLGAAKMRVVVLSLLLSACAHAQHAAPTIFDVSLSLDKHCNLVTTQFNETKAYPLNFESAQKCRLVTHAGTDILHTVFINGGYIVFAENNHGDASEYFSGLLK